MDAEPGLAELVHCVAASPTITFRDGVFRVWRRNAESLIFRVEYSTRVTPGYRLLLRHLSQTGDVAHLPANHGSATVRAHGDHAKTRKPGPLSF